VPLKLAASCLALKLEYLSRRPCVVDASTS
jgi:hypothetical protein